ncbi:MAG: penicillin acylase family protein [Pseudomonadota bacterium]
MKKALSAILLIAAALVALYLVRTPLLKLAFAPGEAPALVASDSLDKPATLSRNELGIPLIEGESTADIVFAMGYADAQDRLAQMVSSKLTAQGRLAEMAGPVALPIDRFMRTTGLPQQAVNIYAACSPEVKAYLQSYAAGVNRWLEENPDSLPPEMALGGYQPEPWSPIDSIGIFTLINFGLSQNLHQEIANLTLLADVPAEHLPWLNPIYPDVDLPVEEAEKLEGLQFGAAADSVAAAIDALPRSIRPGIAASNNWAIAPERTAGGTSIIANDTHLPLSLPSIWSMVHILSPDLSGAGISIPGIPAIIAGYNGHVSWGMTMVMADTQDLYLEKLERIDGKLHYLYEGQWLPVRERVETLRVKGDDSESLTVYETHHGPLLNIGENHALAKSIHPLQPELGDQPFGIAYRSHDFKDDRTLDAFFRLMLSRSFADATAATQMMEAIPLNVIYGDRENIGWQVTGLYPRRGKGLGLLPSPGWVDDYEWQGNLPGEARPAQHNPESGYLATANERQVEPQRARLLSNSWYYPERGERIASMIEARDGHDADSSQTMQLDDFSRLVGKIQGMLKSGAIAGDLLKAINDLPERQQRAAQTFHTHYRSIDGDLDQDTPNGLIHHAFLNAAMEAIFADEVGGTDGAGWRALQALHDTSYGALIDHLLVPERADSPLWDDVTTTDQREDKVERLAVAMASAQQWLESRYGEKRSDWVWGEAHRYHFRSATTQMAPQLDGLEASAVAAMSGFLDRGPYPASGDFSTLNVTGHTLGKEHFDVWLIPEMRLVTDFSSDTPLRGINSTGQSGNPASEHYDDGIEAFLDGDYLPFSLDPEEARESYRLQTRFTPAKKPEE